MNHNFRIRTITAGVSFNPKHGLGDLEDAFRFLNKAKTTYEDGGYQVQTIRIATQPVAEYLSDWKSDSSINKIIEMDGFARENNFSLNIGPVITNDDYDDNFANWAAHIIGEAQQTSFTVFAASEKSGIQLGSIQSAAEAMLAIAKARPQGEGNFNFSATAFVPAGTPFFPAGYHQGEPAFSLGLESPRLLQETFAGTSNFSQAGIKLKQTMESSFLPVEEIAETLSRTTGRRYLGIDVSPAPGGDASIGGAIEALTGKPFGDMSTLSACATITDVLKSLELKTCGYSGLMLPPMEDKVLAQRGIEGRFSISELLLYSSVCGTGLDAVPLPGATSVEQIASIIHDVASLAGKYKKPLSARLMPIPGMKAGKILHSDNPILVDTMIMSL